MSKPYTFRAGFLFAGLGAGARGFDLAESRLGSDRARFENVGGVDIDPLACRDYEYLTKGRGIVGNLSGEFDSDWPDSPPLNAHDLRRLWKRAPDVIFASPPCLPASGLVLTGRGAVPISTVRAGAQVLTHRGRYRPVAKVGRQQYEGTIFGIRLNGTIDTQEFTAEHPLWVRRVERRKATWRQRALGEAKFMPACEVRVGDRIGFPIDAEIEGTAAAFVGGHGDPRVVTKGGKSSGRYAKPEHEATDVRIADLRERALSPDLWFLLGAYLGDGYRRAARHEVIYCVGSTDSDLARRVRAALTSLDLKWNEDRNGGVSNVKLRVHARHLSLLCGTLGDGAAEKALPVPLFNLERSCIEALVEGYRATDGSDEGERPNGAGSTHGPRWKIPSCSLQLLRDVQRLLLRLGILGGVHQSWPGGPQTIMGRTVQTRPRWELSVLTHRKRATAEFIDGAAWRRVKVITTRQTVEEVWNLEVEEDDTFCAPAMATHNCKGHSGLLSSETAETEKYQRMNALVHQGLFNVMEAWPSPPGLIVLENVPRVTSRGAQWLIQVRQNLAARGYVFHEEAHDLRAIGDLGAHRRRYLLVARHPERVPAYVFRPPLKPGKSCGDILAELPLPETEGAGPMHRLPRLSLLNWIRLALIPPGGDWRDLPGMRTKGDRDAGEPRDGAAADEVRGEGDPGPGARDRVEPVCVAGADGVGGAGRSRGRRGRDVPPVRGGQLSLDHAPRRGALGVMDTSEPAATVRGRADVRTGPAAVADERIALTHQRAGRFSDQYRVRGFDEPAGTVTGSTDVQEGAPLVADPRLAEQLAPGATGRDDGKWKDRPGYISVADWEKPTRTITVKASVSGGCGVGAVADPRIAYDGATARNAERYAGSPGLMGVGAWERPLGTVTGSAAVSSSNAVAAVADPRLAVDGEGWGGGRYGVGGWEAPAATVCGESYPSNGSASVADPRVALGADNPGRHENKYRVTPFDEPAGTVCGTDQGGVGSGAPVVADPRIPLGNKGPAFNDILKIGVWDQSAPAVTGAPKPHGGAAVADPRLGLGGDPTFRHNNKFRLDGWDAPVQTVTGATRPEGGAASVGDPRIAITCTPRETSGAYGVLDPARPAYAVTGHGQVDNGPLAVADGRPRVAGWTEAASESATAAADPRIARGAALPPSYQPMTLDEALRLLDQGVKQLPDGKVPVILSPKDGTWHRPLTDLELAALQGLPATLDGAPLQLAGKSRAKHRERIGNAVPVGAAKAIAESLLTALLAAATGQWVLGSTGIWVRRDTGRPAEMEVGDAA